MRVVVTGATGNVGTALRRRLAAEGADVVGIARTVPREAEAGAPHTTWRAVDVSAAWAPDALVEAMGGADAVVHLAWLIQPSHDEAMMRRTNVDGTAAVARAAVAAGVPHLVHASSVGSYARGPKEPPVGEDWPATGIPTSPYSRHKAAAEALLDELERHSPGLNVTRVRPGLVLQAEAAGEIARYFLGPFVPTSVLGRLRLPALPLPSAFRVQLVHADDLADALWRVLQRTPGGAVNVAADPPVGPDDLARAFGAGRAVPAPVVLYRGLAALTWRLRVQPTDAGWVDIAAGTPLMSTERARTELGWSATTDPRAALDGFVAALAAGTGGPTWKLRPRSLLAGRHERAT